MRPVFAACCAVAALHCSACSRLDGGGIGVSWLSTAAIDCHKIYNKMLCVWQQQNTSAYNKSTRIYFNTYIFACLRMNNYVDMFGLRNLINYTIDVSAACLPDKALTPPPP